MLVVKVGCLCCFYFFFIIVLCFIFLKVLYDIEDCKGMVGIRIIGINF